MTEVHAGGVKFGGHGVGRGLLKVGLEMLRNDTGRISRANP